MRQVKVYVVKWSKWEQHLRQHFSRLIQVVDVQKKERICSYKREEDAFRSLIGVLLARYAIHDHFGVAYEDIHLSQNEYGKPLLIRCDNIHFNISHSGEWVAVAVGNCEVGVDIEQVQPINLDVAEYAFTPEEIRYLSTKDPGERQREFYRIWTKKESYVKALGRGLSIPVQSFSVTTDQGTESIRLNGVVNPEWSLRTFDIADDYILSLCALGDSMPIAVTYLDVEQLILPFL